MELTGYFIIGGSVIGGSLFMAYTIAKIGEAYAEAYDELTKGLKEINTNLDEIQKDLREIADNSKLENKFDHKR